MVLQSKDISRKSCTLVAEEMIDQIAQRVQGKYFQPVEQEELMRQYMGTLAITLGHIILSVLETQNIHIDSEVLMLK